MTAPLLTVVETNAFFLYGKQEQTNLTPQQKREVAGFAAAIKAAAKVRRIKP